MSGPRTSTSGSSRCPRAAVLARVLVAGAALSLVAACSGDGDDGGGEGSTGDFCADMARFDALQAEGDELFAGSGDDPEAFRDVFGRFDEAIDAVRESAPAEIETDVRLVADTTQQLIDTFEAADYDFVALATDPQYAEVLVSLDDARVTEANDRLAVYVRSTCGTTDTTDTTDTGDTGDTGDTTAP